MPLTEFVERPAMRAAFKEVYRRPELPEGIRNAPVLAASCGRGHSAVGTAFDYLARFMIARHARSSGHQVVDCGWLAEGAVAMAEGDRRYVSHASHWRRMMAEARRLHDGFVAGSEPVERVARCVQVLAQADLLARLGEFNPHFRPAPDIAAELVRLSQVFDPSSILAHGSGPVLLNPGFALSHLTQGADADVVAGDLILDFKSVPEVGVPVGYMRQLVGYAVLHHLGGASDSWGPVASSPCRRVGLHFARHGVTLTWDLEEILPGDGLSRFVEAFRREAGYELPEPAHAGSASFGL